MKKSLSKRRRTLSSDSADMEFMVRLANGLNDSSLKFDPKKDRLSILRTLYIDHLKSIPEYLLEKFDSLSELEHKLEMMETVQPSGFQH